MPCLAVPCVVCGTLRPALRHAMHSARALRAVCAPCVRHFWDVLYAICALCVLSRCKGRAMPCCAVPFRAVPWGAMCVLYCATLCCAVLCVRHAFLVLCCAVLCCAVLCCAVRCAILRTVLFAMLYAMPCAVRCHAHVPRAPCWCRSGTMPAPCCAPCLVPCVRCAVRCAVLCVCVCAHVCVHIGRTQDHSSLTTGTFSFIRNILSSPLYFHSFFLDSPSNSCMARSLFKTKPAIGHSS